MKIRDSFALWPIAPFGGEDDKDESGNSATGSDTGAGAGGAAGDRDEAGKASGASKSDNDDDDDDDEDEFKGLTPAEIKALAKKNASDAKEAERKRKAAQKILDDQERAKNDETTNLKNDFQVLKEENTTLRSTMTRQAIIGAIRDDTRYEWHDPEMVAQQLDPAKVTVDDNGRVEGIKGSLPKVAKDHPFLLKKDNTTDAGNGSGAGGNGNGARGGAIGGGSNGGPTGFQPGQGGTSGGAGNEVDSKKLAENYPALAARV